MCVQIPTDLLKVGIGYLSCTSGRNRSLKPKNSNYAKSAVQITADESDISFHSVNS